MALQSYVGSLSQPTGVGNQSYSGVGFQPKAIIFFLTNRTSDGNSPNYGLGVGAAVSSSQRFAICNNGVDATGGNSDTDTRHDNTKCVCVIDNGGTVLGAADLVSMDSDGFTLNWTQTDASQRIVGYLALGGSSLTNVAIKEITSPTATGNQGYTGVGFQPDCIVVFSAGSGSAPPSSNTAARLGIGVATSASARVTAGHIANNASTGSHQSTFQTTKVIQIPTNTAGNSLISGDLVSLDSDGFTINWDVVQGTARYGWVLCLKGGGLAVGTITQPTSNGNQAITGLSFKPTGVFIVGSPRTATGFSTPAEVSVGAASDSTHRAVVWAGHADGSNAAADSALDRTKVVKLMTEGTPTLNAEADFVSFDQNGFTLNWSTTDATQRLMLYLALGTPGRVIGSVEQISEAIRRVQTTFVKKIFGETERITETILKALGKVKSLAETVRLTETISKLVSTFPTPPAGRVALEVYTAAGVKQGFIPVVLKALTDEEVNEISSWEYTVPARYKTDVALGNQVYLVREGEGTIFKGYVERIEADARDSARIILSGKSLSAEWAEENTYYGVNINDTPGDDLTALAAGLTNTWTISDPDALATAQNWRADGMSLWAAARQIADIAGAYLRETSTTRQLQIKSSNADSGIRLCNIEYPDPSLAANMALITELIGYREDAGSIINRVVPFGASQGDYVLDLSQSTRSSPYTIQNLTPKAPSGILHAGGFDHGGNGGAQFAANFAIQGRNRVIVAVILFQNTIDTVTRANYGGTVSGGSLVEGNLPGFQVVRDVSGSYAVELWAVLNPFLASLDAEKNMIVTYSATTAWGMDMALQDVDIPSVDAANCAFASGTSTSPSVALNNCLATDLILAAVITANGVTITPAGNMSHLSNVTDNTSGSNASYDKVTPAVGTVTASWTLGSSNAWKAVIWRIPGAKNYYLEDAASVSSYRRRVAVIQAKDIHLSGITAVAADANALYDYASTYLQRAKDPLTTYGWTNAIHLPASSTWNVGDTLKLEYTGLVQDEAGNHLWLSVNANVIIAARRMFIDEDGVLLWRLKLVSSLRKPADLLDLAQNLSSVQRLPAL